MGVFANILVYAVLAFCELIFAGVDAPELRAKADSFYTLSGCLALVLNIVFMFDALDGDIAANLHQYCFDVAALLMRFRADSGSTGLGLRRS
jgi:hypothetical protein